MKFLKKFNEGLSKDDMDDITDILQDVCLSEMKIYDSDFTKYSNDILVVYFDNHEIDNILQFEQIHKRLSKIGYVMNSRDTDKDGCIWFLIMKKETEDMYYYKLKFKFIEILKFQNIHGSDYSEINFSDSSEIIINRYGSHYEIYDSVTDDTAIYENKVLANIGLLETQHKLNGILKSFGK